MSDFAVANALLQIAMAIEKHAEATVQGSPDPGNWGFPTRPGRSSTSWTKSWGWCCNLGVPLRWQVHPQTREG